MSGPSTPDALRASCAQGERRGRSGRGLLLSGGAARGAFQAGVVAALDRAGLRFDAIVGTSVGAVNGAAMLHGYGPTLPAMWRDNLRAVCWFDAKRLLRARSPFLISEAMRVMVARYGDMERIRGHATELIVSTTDWQTGRNVLFSSHDRAAAWTDDEIVAQFMASLTIPVICSERIVIRGRRYCDGALSENYPLAPFVERGCREVVIVDPSPGAGTGLLSGPIKAFAPLGRRLDVVPLAAARLFAGVFKGAIAPPPASRVAEGTLRLRVVMPPPEFRMSGLDFTSMEAIDRGAAMGEEAGARLAEELVREGEPGVEAEAALRVA